MFKRKDKSGRYYSYIVIDETAKEKNNRYELYQRYLYKKHIGKIKDGNIIIFKDRNNENFDINNLEQITRAENLKINSKTRLLKKNKEQV